MSLVLVQAFVVGDCEASACTVTVKLPIRSPDVIFGAATGQLDPVHAAEVGTVNETWLVAFPVFGSIKPPLVVVNLIAVPAGITLPRWSTTVNVTFWVGLVYVAVVVHGGKVTCV